jgi:nitroreductase
MGAGRFAHIERRALNKEYSTRAKNMLLELVASNPKTRSYELLLRDESFNIFHDAATRIVISVQKDGPYAQADGWLAAANLMLAAYDLGLGTWCIGLAIPLLNTNDVKSELGIPPGAVAVPPIIVGFPGSSPPPPRPDPVIRAWKR